MDKFDKLKKALGITEFQKSSWLEDASKRNFDNESFVPHNLTVELIELGFNEYCIGRYFVLLETIIKPFLNEPKQNYLAELELKAPLWQQVFDWFEEKQYYIEKIVTTTPNEILDISYYIKSWKTLPIKVDIKPHYRKSMINKIILISLIDILKNGK